MLDVTTIGLIAAISTSASFLPQAVKVIRSQNTDAISLSMYSLFVFGVSLWLVYGILLEDLPMLIANTFTLFFAVIILTIKIKHTLRDRNAAKD